MRTRSAVLGFVILTILLTAGTAQSLSGTNSVFTDDIAPGAVTTLDLKDNAVTSGKITTGGVFGSDIQNDSVTGIDVANGSLDARDIAIIRGSFPFDFGSIAAHSCLGQVVATGGNPTDGNVILAMPSQAITETGPFSFSYQDSTTANGFRFKVCNTSTAAVDPPPATLEWMMIGSPS